MWFLCWAFCYKFLKVFSPQVLSRKLYLPAKLAPDSKYVYLLNPPQPKWCSSYNFHGHYGPENFCSCLCYWIYWILLECGVLYPVSMFSKTGRDGDPPLIVAIDLQPMAPIEGVIQVQGDITNARTAEVVLICFVLYSHTSIWTRMEFSLFE